MEYSAGFSGISFFCCVPSKQWHSCLAKHIKKCGEVSYYIRIKADGSFLLKISRYPARWSKVCSAPQKGDFQKPLWVQDQAQQTSTGKGKERDGLISYTKADKTDKIKCMSDQSTCLQGASVSVDLCASGTWNNCDSRVPKKPCVNIAHC